MQRLFVYVAFLGLSLSLCPLTRAEAPLVVNPGDKIVLIGNTFAERMTMFGHYETRLHARYPEHKLVFRNLGWSADEVALRPRQNAFDDHGHKLEDHKPQVIVAAFGFNESFGGEKGLAKFEKDLVEFIKKTTSTSYDGKTPPKLILLSPIANEDRTDRKILAGTWNNARIEMYTAAMKKVAGEHQVACIDLFTPTKTLLADSSASGKYLTINGVHLNDAGYAALAPILDEALSGPAPAYKGDLGKIHAEVQEKNKQFYYDYRAVNGCYIYGQRKTPFGVTNFPAEFAKLRKMIEVRDGRIWQAAMGGTPKQSIDDSGTGDFVQIETNYKNEIHLSSPEEAKASFTLPPDFEISLFASEVDFPDLKDPVAITFDRQGRLWVTTNPSYPQYLPGTPPDDKILILEDTNRDGKADKQTVFARGLHLPIGIELADGGAYVSLQPNLHFLKDTNGDDVADTNDIVLHGFDTADSHHSISAFEAGPGGEMYFQEGTFHYSQIETPYGPERVSNAGVFRYEPRTEKLDVYVSYGFANPWGHCFDDWGQNFVADASGGANYFAAAFSGDLDYPRKHPNLKQFLVKQWRPTSGCEIVSSRHFPDDMQGDFLLNNCIGFQGTLQYRFKKDDKPFSGFAADPVEPLVRSSDPNYRPVDLVLGPDGALYIADWFNPLVGHMQHSLRDPNRDHVHGRVWRVTHKKRPLVEPAKIVGASIEHLLDLLKTPELRTREKARLELRERDTATVVAAVDKWLAGLKGTDSASEHLRLEALWVKQQHDVVDLALLKQLLTSKEFPARAAATRVLCYQRDRVPEVLTVLETLVNDEHPRVRLEAVRALSFFDSQAALDVAVQSLIHEQDEYLEYVLKETTTTLDQRIKRAEAQ
ncbi:MAG: azurin [Planctomycetota bacterium]|nr:MAG: azurin [Planctomycetota bacterium]